MAHLSSEYIERLYCEFGRPRVVDDIIRLRAQDGTQVPILAYPRTASSPADYEYFTGNDVDRFVNNACRALQARGLDKGDHSAVALMGPSDLDYVVAMFALMRMGYSVLCLSVRLPPTAVDSLIAASDCDNLVYGNSAQNKAAIGSARAGRCRCIEIPTRDCWDRPEFWPYTRSYDPEVETLKPALILHSSGSTGMPKHRTISHAAMLTHLPHGQGLESFNALPWYHMYGLSTSFGAMWRRRTAHITAALRAIRPQAVYAVPYVLKLIAETPEGVKALKTCISVTGAGSRVPDELGDRLMAEGVRLSVAFGATEAGMLGDSIRREAEDNAWNYIRLYANVRPHVFMKPLGRDLYELVYLKTHPALTSSNSDAPRGSFHSRDVFTPHSTVDSWKYVTRIDDRVTLLNGEKVLPLPIEGCVREHPLVNEAVVAGVDRPVRDC